MRNLYAPGPGSRYAVVPRHGERAVLAFASTTGRFFPVVALRLPNAVGRDPFLRLSAVPLPHFNPKP